ncbi:MAG TPA: pseudouridine synthase [Longimicrobiales bacterium]|nr:pseudouridine synthase [Longimicrobiales bacterium]
MAEPIRLQKFLSAAGVASRRAAETLITDGRVSINGAVVTELGVKVDPTQDVVEVDGRRVRRQAIEWYALFKPRGCISSRKDPEGRQTIYEFLPEGLGHLFSVGRLDYDSEGLILLTNDGDTANRLMHPRYEVEREYEVELDAPADAAIVERLTSGVVLEDGPARAERARLHPDGGITLTLREGRNREVRRMIEAVGRRVTRLRRVRYATVTLGNMRPREVRRLRTEEIAALRGRDRRD